MKSIIQSKLNLFLINKIENIRNKKMNFYKEEDKNNLYLMMTYSLQCY